MASMDMMTPGELSEMTSIPTRTIVRLASTGVIPAVKVGRQWRFIRTDVERWLKTKASNTRHRVLVVDDDQELVKLMKLVLQKSGHEIVVAQGGQKALDILARDKVFSLLVIDLQMPEVSGPDVVDWMHENDVSIPILIITGYPESDLMDRVLQHGPCTTLKKPFDPDEIRGAVDGVLRGVKIDLAVE